MPIRSCNSVFLTSWSTDNLRGLYDVFQCATDGYHTSPHNEVGIMYDIIVSSGMDMMLLGTIFTAVAVPINNRIVGIYNRKIGRQLQADPALN